MVGGVVPCVVGGKKVKRTVHVRALSGPLGRPTLRPDHCVLVKSGVPNSYSSGSYLARRMRPPRVVAGGMASCVGS